MYISIDEFLADWTAESALTGKLFEALNDVSLSVKVYNEGRSLGFLAWHIITSLGEMGEKMGLFIDAPPEGTPVPLSAQQLLDLYTTASVSLRNEISEKWTDGMLSDKLNMYGEEWTRNTSLQVLVRHEIHHRAQMTVLMRQAGLKVPGLYGPSREEWRQFNMSAPE